jgi:hypothetical protein
MSEVPRIRPPWTFSCPLALLLALLVGTGLRAADPFQEKVLPYFRQWEHVATFLKKERCPPPRPSTHLPPCAPWSWQLWNTSS